METWFLNHVLGLSLAVLLLGLQPPLGAGTPGNNSTDSVTAGFDYSPATDEVSDVENNNATSTSYSSESLSPSQRNILLTHTAETHTAAAGHFDTEQTQTFTETSSRSLEAISLSTEPLTSTLVIATTEASSSSISSGSSSISTTSTSGSSSSSSSSIGTGSSSSSSSISSSTGSSTGSGSSSTTSTGSSSSSTGTGSSSSSSSTSTGSISSSSSSTSSGSSSSGSSSSSSSSSSGSTSSGSSSISTTSTSGSSSGSSSSSSGSISTSGSSSGSISSSSTGTGSSSSISSSIGTGSSSGSSSGSSTGTGSSSSGSGSGSSSSSISSSSGSSTGTGSISSSTGSGSSSSTSTSTSTGSISSSIGSSTGSGSSSTGSSSSGSTSSGSSSSGSSSTSSGSSSSTSSGSSSSTSSGTSSGSSSSTSSGSSSSTSSGSSSSSTGSGSSSTSSGSSSSRGWKDFVNTDQVPDVSTAVSSETSSFMLTDETRLPQDSPDTTLRQVDASSSMSHTALHTDSTYTSTTITRAGERTLLSVTSSSSNSTSSVFTEDSNSHQPPSTWGISAKATETEDYTHSALSTRTDSRDTTDQHMTSSFKGTFPETGSPGGPRGTHSLTRQPNGTSHQHTSTSEETSNSTPPLRVTEPSTDQSEVSISSTPPITSPAGGPTNISGTDQGSGSSVETSTESSTGVLSSSTENQEDTEWVSSQTSEQSVGFGLTTGPPTVSSSTSGLDNSLTDTTALITEVFPTSMPVTVTERSHITEENTFKATGSINPPTTTTTTTTTATTTPSPLPATSSSRFTSTASSSAPGSLTEATILYTTPPTTVSSTPALQTSTMHPTHRASPSQTQGPSTGMAKPTKTTTLRVETSTGALGITTSRSLHITTTYMHSTPTKSTEVQQTTGKQTDRGTTELVVTTSPTDFKSTKVPPLPENPCVSNPCMNGGMCVSYKNHQYTCQCQQAWTGPTCNQDMDECEDNPCPVGSKCVNRRGSFSCECPLGFDLEDGRTCTRAKTFLGTFSVKKQPHDPVIFKSTTVHEIQREIILLLNASLSVLRGYSRSLLSKKGEDGLRISAVNMFSISTDVTSAEVNNSIQMFLSNCSSSLAHCRMVLHHQLDFHVESLCVAQKTQCDTERSTCTDDSGTAHCQCLQGYYKHNPEDQSCLECGDGYKLENGTCVPCMFGFGGFNCGNFYKLIAVVVSPAGGALLLILVIALIVTCCKKDKNDINKIIFKSGDLQMSPYADFAKNNRISMEWGRETIEMQENGSTKNLLQMTDIYYSPALRNSDLERNGLYPFPGLPGSRHSCIYPAQWNPSFISDDSRRRDYF